MRVSGTLVFRSAEGFVIEEGKQCSEHAVIE